MNVSRLRERKTSKIHYCHQCGAEIPKRVFCTEVTGDFDGRYSTVYVCDGCRPTKRGNNAIIAELSR